MVWKLSIRARVKGWLTAKEDSRYRALRQKKTVSYTQWVSELDKELCRQARVWATEEDCHKEARVSMSVSGAEAREMFPGDCEYMIFRVGPGVFGEGFCGYVRKYFEASPETMLLYGDEDMGTGGSDEGAGPFRERSKPWFKPDWSPDLLDSFFYFGSVVAVRGELIRRMSQEMETTVCFLEKEKREAVGTVGMWFYVVKDFDAYERWIHGLVEAAGGYRQGSQAVGHVTHPWFTSGSPELRKVFLEESEYLREKKRKLQERFRGNGADWGGGASLEEPLVSVVILSKDHPELLEKCLGGCYLSAKGEGGAALAYEVILVDNGSSQENRRRVESLTEEWKNRIKITYLYQPQEFNFSELCNLGAAKAAGRLLFFLNDDVVLCRQGCMEELAMLAHRPWTGAVGMKLYYPDSVRMQHTGITNLPMGPVHKLQFLEDNKEYYCGANRGRHNVMAVTAACLMVAREKYLAAGGFARELAVAFNDVDFCFRLYELGYHNLCVNDMYAYHHESLSRGNDEAPEKLERLLKERDRLYERHPTLEGKDPYYSPCLNREGLDVTIRPAYLTAGNEVQKVRKKVGRFSTKGYRQDACLLVRVEECRNNGAIGYGVVLGDNNACYDKVFLLGRIEKEKGFWREEPLEIYAVALLEQYRPDLEENMPDQVNVGLGGFMLEMGNGVLPGGRYRIGLGARNRVTGTKILNWSNRVWEVAEAE